MKNKQTDINELSEKVMLGLQKALRKLVETSAAEGRSLVIKVNGEIKKVPAKELLHKLPY
ncbi:MAG: hypothetical protein SFU87_00680 [Chitinophagaceae bacterium]|jgi:uncharacterized protein YicC (UPF0701 family)|nr:hypothetical protein [Chitinophagaceae bacterium]